MPIDDDDPSADVDDFDDSIDWFRSRVPISEEEYQALNERAKEQAFTVAGVAQLDLVTDVWEQLDSAIENGDTLEEFKAAVAERLYNAWGEDDAYRVETIFRTNLQLAYSAGRHRMQTSPAVRRLRPFWRYVATLDSRTSPICRPLHGTVLPADHPWWSSHYPPLHHSCRSTAQALTEDQAKELGIDDEAPGGEAADGFGGTPDLGEWEPEIEEYPPPLQAVFKR